MRHTGKTGKGAGSPWRHHIPWQYKLGIEQCPQPYEKDWMMNDIEQKILSDYAVALAKWQIELYRGRNQRKDDAIQRYFNSTPARNTFARMMFLAYQDDKLVYTKSEIARQLFITRQAASQMVDDCLAEGVG